MSEEGKIVRLDLGDGIISFSTPTLDEYISPDNESTILEDSSGETTYTIKIEEEDPVVHLAAPSDIDVQCEEPLWESDIKNIYNGNDMWYAEEILDAVRRYERRLMSDRTD